MHAYRLDSQIQALELRLSSLRAANLLAADKLDYDVRVLGERAPENVAAMSVQRRRLNRLRDAVSGLKARPCFCLCQQQQSCAFSSCAKHLPCSPACWKG